MYIIRDNKQHLIEEKTLQQTEVFNTARLYGEQPGISCSQDTSLIETTKMTQEDESAAIAVTARN